MKVVIDASNISLKPGRMLRTGIQEVVYQTVLAAVRARSQNLQHEFVILPHFPRRKTAALSSDIIIPYPDQGAAVLEQVERELGLSSKEVWGLDLRSKNYLLSDDEIWRLLAEADLVHIQGMLNAGPLLERLQEMGKRPLATMILYDLIPIVVPEYCNSSVPRWYERAYLPGILDWVDDVICISRNTAIDLLNCGIAAKGRAKPARVTVLPLPYEFPALKLGSKTDSDPLLARLGVAEKQYIVFLGSFEPRKNFIGLLEGFERLVERQPSSEARLLLVGGTAWKEGEMERRLARSPCREKIVRAGYLEDSDLAKILARAGAVCMLSHYEGYGLPLAQGFSMGVPVVTTLGSSLPEACGGRGIFVVPDDPESVAAGLSVALEANVNGTWLNKVETTDRTWNSYFAHLVGIWETLAISNLNSNVN